MSPANGDTRRSDEIRRRRLGQSHAARTGASSQPSDSLVNRMLGGSARRRTRSSVTTETVRTSSPKAGKSAGIRRTSVLSRSGRSRDEGMPPVMARQRMPSATRPVNRRLDKSRRVYNVSLRAEGAEMRLPSLPRVRFSWRIASIFLLAVLGAALYWMWTSPAYQVEAAEISGLKRIAPGDVNKALALTGAPIFMVDQADIQATLLEAFPEFSSADVLVELPNTVLITVTERTPVLLWEQDSHAYLIDEEGMTFPARTAIAPGTLPVVKAAGSPPALPGAESQPTPEPSATETPSVKDMLPDNMRVNLPDENKAAPFLAPEMVKTILLISDQAPEGSVIVYDPAHGFGWQDRRGWMVYFGDFVDMELKVKVYRGILEQIKASGNRPAMISVEYVHAPYYRVEAQENN